MVQPSRSGMLTLACAAALLASGAAFAQESKAPSPEAAKIPALSDSARSATREEVGKQLKMLADSLNLTQQQRDKVRPILMAHVTQMKMIRDKYAAMDRTPENREAMKKDAMTLRDATDAKLAGVLTPDQMTKYKAWRESMMSKAKDRMGAKHGDGGSN